MKRSPKLLPNSEGQLSRLMFHKLSQNPNINILNEKYSICIMANLQLAVVILPLSLPD